MAADRRITLTLLTGFLGAGKTTLLNRLLKNPEVVNTAVIVNEFGEIPIDHLLVERPLDDLVELGNGCLCCTVRGALVDTLAKLAARPQKLDRVILETTGLADPGPLLSTVLAHPELSRAYRIGGVITVLDAVNGAAALDAHEEARRQVALADLLIVTKADLDSPEARRKLLQRLSILNPDVELFDSRAPDVTSASLLDGSTFPGKRHSIATLEKSAHASVQDGYQTVSLRYGGRLHAGAVENLIELLTRRQGERILRIKGLFETMEKPEQPLLVQGVRNLLQAERLPGWPDAERGARFVVIGCGLDTSHVKDVFAACTGELRADTPDREALQNNPLAIAGLRM